MPTVLVWPERLLRKPHAHCSRLRAWRSLYDWLCIVHCGKSTVAAISGLHRRAGYGQFGAMKADSLIGKIQRRGGTVREIDVAIRVTAIISALVICIIVCLSWAVNHYRDNAITYKKAQRDKMPENWSWRTRQLLEEDASAWCCCADAKYTKVLAWC